MMSCSRFRYILLSLIPILSLFSCPPDTDIRREFDKGNALYKVTGTVPIGSITAIKVEVDGKPYKEAANEEVLTIPIVQGENKIRATAYAGAIPDPTPAEDSFVSPTEEDARKIIDNVFAGKTGYGTLEKDVLVSPGISGSFRVDYLVTKPDGTNAVVNYTGYEDDLNAELLNKDVLDEIGVPNRYFARVPQSEFQLDEFISGGFK